jgi:hypothetical protein
MRLLNSSLRCQTRCNHQQALRKKKFVVRLTTKFEERLWQDSLHYGIDNFKLNCKIADIPMALTFRNMSKKLRELLNVQRTDKGSTTLLPPSSRILACLYVDNHITYRDTFVLIKMTTTSTSLNFSQTV